MLCFSIYVIITWIRQKVFIVMNEKIEIFQQATKNILSRKVILYHLISPISEKDFLQIEQNGCFNPSTNALGGQSNGYYFFTTRKGAENHIQTNKDSWESVLGKKAYMVECEADIKSVKYPDWKLDYEALQDFFFDMIYNVAKKQHIKFDNVEITGTADKKLEISFNGKFSRIKSFSANDHSGLIEKISDFLYNHNEEFKNAYDKLLQDVFSGKGENQELYAVKTNIKPKIIKITKIELAEKTQPTVSQIDKFLSRYGRGRR